MSLLLLLVFPSAIRELVSVVGLRLLLLFSVVASLFFFRQLRLLSPLLLCFVCSGSFCIRSSFSTRCGSRCAFLPSSTFFLMLRLQLLFLLFLLVFCMLLLRLLPSVFLIFCLLWRLRLLLAILLWLLLFLFAVFPEAVPQVSILPFPAFLLFLLSGLSQGSSFFIDLFPRLAGSLFVSSSLCFFEVFSAPASVPPLLLSLALFGCV